MIPQATVMAVAAKTVTTVAQNLIRTKEGKESSSRTMTSLFRTVSQQKGDLQEKPKHINWSRDREFTPLDQPLEKVLKYLLSQGMVKLPKIADPPVIMGRFKEQFCKFHRTTGHDTEYCFVLKHLIQDCIDKNILIEDEEEGKMEILSAPFRIILWQPSQNAHFLPQNHICFMLQ